VDEYYRAIRLLPAWLAQPLARLPQNTAEKVHELRLRTGCGICLSIAGQQTTSFMCSAAVQYIPIRPNWRRAT